MFIIDEEDLPIFQPYLDTVIEHGGILHRQSRWLNAASFSLTARQKNIIEDLPFVNAVQPVRIFYRHDEVIPSDHVLQKTSAETLIYGISFAQNNMISATKAHEIGITGKGVLVGMLDTGFRWRVHEALQNSQVLAEHDFIQNDDNTANEAGDASQQDLHGTLTMSVLGGYMPGRLIGPAFGVQFLLAKTEDIRSETRIEEDNWMAAIEWMEAQGIDIASSSLGYNIFDDGTGYRWENGDFNGRTAVTSRAAVRAARLGVVVCTAMGNEGNGDGTRGTMLAPADADSIISVGAVTFSRTLAGFSSTGPTNDGRTKPEIVAPGASVYGALPGQSTYGFSSGTSLSTPLTAASAALVLSARPELTVMQLRNALTSTSDTIASGDPRISTYPNNFVGHGLVNPFKAILSFGPVFSNMPTLSLVDSQNVISTIIVSKFGIRADSVFLRYSTASASGVIAMTHDSSMVFPTSGRFRGTIPQQPFGTLVRITIEARDSAGNAYTSPSPYTQSQWEFRYGSTTIGLPPRSFNLHQNYPNPFNSTTTIRFDVEQTTTAELTIYNLLGQKVRTLYQGLVLAGSRTVVWDGANDNGRPVSSGVFFYSLRTPTFSAVKKMMLLR